MAKSGVNTPASTGATISIIPSLCSTSRDPTSTAPAIRDQPLHSEALAIDPDRGEDQEYRSGENPASHCDERMVDDEFPAVADEVHPDARHGPPPYA